MNKTELKRPQFEAFSKQNRILYEEEVNFSWAPHDSKAHPMKISQNLVNFCQLRWHSLPMAFEAFQASFLPA